MSLLPVFIPIKVFQEFKNRLKPEHFVSTLSRKGNYVLGLNIDTEFQTQSNDDVFKSELKAKARQMVTVQVSDLLNQHPLIFVHEDQVTFAQQTNRAHLIRHPTATSDCVAVNYLKELGYNVVLTYDPNAYLYKRTLTVNHTAFFLTVDVLPCFKGKCLKAVEQLILDKKVAHERHFKQVIQPGSKGKRKLRLPYFITIEGQKFALVIDFQDLVAAQGKASFKDFCQNVGLAMDDKDLAGSNITRMADWYFESPLEYDKYALGDVTTYPAWALFVQQVNDLIASIVSVDYVQDPALTIGSTTNRILNAKRLQYLGLPLKERDSDLFKRLLGTPLFKSMDDERNLGHTQLKVDGGRCRNNHPTLTKLIGALCDVDLKGAYTSSMMYLPTFYGTPSLETFNSTPLKSILKKFKKRLLPYHWTMRISTAQDLSFNQDFILSFVDYRWKDRKCDSEGFQQTGELDYNSGTSKIFSKQIYNGMLTTDILDVILHTWTAKAQEEFFDKCHVHSLLFYDPQHEIKDVEIFVQHISQEDTEKTSCGWHQTPLKDMGIESFREERKKHLKNTPQNTLFKLVGNTAYGAIVSHFFLAQNPVTANNITAHIRVAVYLAEKALGIKQTITDGGIFHLNEVLSTNRGGKIHIDKLYNVHNLSKRDLNHQLHLKRSGLGNHHWQIKGNCEQNLKIYCDDLEMPLKDAEALVNSLCLQHVKQTFPTMPLLQNPDLEFEMKAFYNKATFHGSSNYAFWYDEEQHTVKMRSYDRKRHDGFTLNKQDVLIKETTYHDQMSPAQWMHHQLNIDPTAVPLPLPFIKNEICKTASFANYFHLRPDSPIKPGDNLKKMGCPKWASPNQFTFQTKQQYDNWNKATQQLLRRFGISWEIFFLKDGKVHMINMLQTIQTQIDKGLGVKNKEEILAFFDPHRNRQRIGSQNLVLQNIKQSKEQMTQRLTVFYNAPLEELNLEIEDLEYLDDIDEFDLK